MIDYEIAWRIFKKTMANAKEKFFEMYDEYPSDFNHGAYVSCRGLIDLMRDIEKDLEEQNDERKTEGV